MGSQLIASLVLVMRRNVLMTEKSEMLDTNGNKEYATVCENGFANAQEWVCKM